MGRPENNQSILEVDQVWKKYCRNLRRGMWYGLCDVGRQLWPGSGTAFRPKDQLRPGEFFAVKDVSFSMQPGECVGLIGPNGAGKSSVLKMVNGLLRPDAGRIRIRGRIGALIELGTGFNPQLSGRENVFINGAVLGLKKREIDSAFDSIVDFAELGHVIDDPIKSYSSGMRMRLGFSVAANLRPQLLIMDEVLAVGDVGFRMKCFAHLNKLIEEGTSIILVTHAVTMLPRVATRLIVFDKGMVEFDGEVAEGLAIYDEKVAKQTIEQQEKRTEFDRQTTATLISNVTTQNAQQQEQSEFITGDSLRLQIEIDSEVAIPTARLIVTLSSASVTAITSISSKYLDFRMEIRTGKNRIELSIAELPLLVGAYFFNVSLYGEEIADFYQRRSGVGTFRVVGPPIDANGMGIGGLMKMKHEWRQL